MKRNYTVSDKVLAANRRNLVKARAVPKSIRYRDTARRLTDSSAMDTHYNSAVIMSLTRRAA
jgi:hypothetical protein